MRKLFSQREGFKPVRSTLQLGSMENELRSRLWDLVTLNYWAQVSGINLDDAVNGSMRLLLRKLWHNYFKKPVDTISWDWRRVQSELRSYFFDCEWNEVYDFIEFLPAENRWTGINDSFRSACNKVLEEELSGYRFVADQITPITAEEEIVAVEEAAKLTGKLSPVTNHIDQALALLSNRENPDYRNSIKESISAVEALCRIVADTPKATLGDALKKIETKVKMHPALNQAFNKLYGYTSDADGIRHSLLDEPNLRFEDAKYMLVTCSSFINYVVAKAIEAGISL
jgi:hypothetical protein